MERLGFLTVFIMICTVVFCNTDAFSQPAESSGGEAPAAVESGPNFPEYIVTPREDVNPYSLSTMSKSTETGFREGAGTLGTTERRQSNLEINASLDAKRQERQKAAQAEEEKDSNNVDEPIGTIPKSSGSRGGNKTFSPGVKRGLFTWTDDDGVLHATNNLGLVPIKYQVQALENKQSIKTRKKSGKKR